MKKKVITAQPPTPRKFNTEENTNPTAGNYNVVIGIPKKYCIDFDSNVEKVEIKQEGNKIKCQDVGGNFYKIFVWQQILINKILESFQTAILEVEYIDDEFTKTLEIKQPFEIDKTRVISSQCKACKNRVTCKEFQKALTDDFIISIKNDEQLYTTYLAAGARLDALNGIKDTLRKQIDKAIENGKGKLVLGTMGLTLSIKEFMKDSFPFQVALNNKLLDENNCKIKITEFRKKIKGTEWEKQLIKVPWQKRLNIE